MSRIQIFGNLTVETHPAEKVSEVRLPPYLFVPGAAHNHRLWQIWQTELARQGVESHAVSLRGHRPSSGKVRGVTPVDYVEDVRTIACALELEEGNFILAGHSMGGLVVQRYAWEHPVQGLALVGSWSPSRAQQATTLTSKHIFKEFPISGWLSLINPKLLFQNRAFAEKYLIPGASQQVLDLLLKEVLCDETRSLGKHQVELERIGFRDVQTTHILALRGEQDPFCTAEDLDWLATDYAGKTISAQTFPGGHDLMLTHPEASKLLYEFALSLSQEGAK